MSCVVGRYYIKISQSELTINHSFSKLLYERAISYCLHCKRKINIGGSGGAELLESLLMLSCKGEGENSVLKGRTMPNLVLRS